jgi:ferredoxin
MPKVTIVNEKKEIEVPAGSVLRTELRKAGVQVHSGMDQFLNMVGLQKLGTTVDQYVNCMGLGLCGTCKVHVKAGMENTGPKSIRERINLSCHPQTMFSSIGHEAELRLACQTVVNGDISIEVRPEFNLSGENFWQKPYPNK